MNFEKTLLTALVFGMGATFPTFAQTLNRPIATNSSDVEMRATLSRDHSQANDVINLNRASNQPQPGLPNLGSNALNVPAEAYNQIHVENRKLRLAQIEILRSEIFGLFHAFEKADDTRIYKNSYAQYAGTKGKMTDEQLEALKTLGDSFRIERNTNATRWEPNFYKLVVVKELTDADKEKVSVAFNITRDDLETRLLILRLRVEQKLEERKTREEAIRKFIQEEIPDDLTVLSIDELEQVIRKELEVGTYRSLYRAVSLWKPEEQELFYQCVSERFARDLNDCEYARFFDNWSRYQRERGMRDHEDTRVKIEKMIKQSLESRPNSWEVAYIAANAILSGPSYDKVDGVNGQKTVRCDELKRIRALRILDATLHDLEKDFFRSDDLEINPRAFLKTYQRLLSTSYSGENPNLEQKTDFSQNPELLDETKEARRVVVQAVTPGKQPLKLTRDGNVATYVPAHDFASAQNDGERLALCDYLLEGLDKSANATTESDRLAIFAMFAQSRLGVERALELGASAQRSIFENLPQSAIKTDYDAQRVQDALVETTALVKQLEEIKKLQDEETLLVERASNVPQKLKFRRATLHGYDNFIRLYQRSLELEENYDALVGLAREYQLRAQYDEAREYWKRAELAMNKNRRKSFSSLRTTTKSTNAFEPTAMLALLDEIQKESSSIVKKASSFTVDYDASRVEGNRCTLVVRPSEASKADFVVTKLNLSNELAMVCEKEFCQSALSFPEFVCARIAEGKTKASTDDPICWTEEFAPDVEFHEIDLPIRTRGAYCVEARLEDGTSVLKALVLLNERVVEKDPFSKRFYLRNFTTGSPCANQNVEFYAPCGGINASDPQTLLRQTDEQGVVNLTKDAIDLSRAVAFVQPEDVKRRDVDVDLFDLTSNGTRTFIVNSNKSDNEIENEHNKTYPFEAQDYCQNLSSEIVLATSRPIYTPGEKVEFQGYLLRNDNQSSFPINAQSVFVAPTKSEKSQYPSIKDTIAEIPIRLSPSGAFSGEFELPSDARPGLYAIGFYNNSVEFGLFAVGVKGNIERPTAPVETRDAINEDLVALDIPKQVKQFGEKVDVKVRAQKNARVSITRFCFLNREPQYFDESQISLKNGEGTYQFEINAFVPPCEIIAVRAGIPEKLQTIYYSVGVGDKQIPSRPCELETPKTPVKPGEKLTVRALFPTSEGIEAFSGDATIALYDAKLDWPSSNFKKYQGHILSPTERIARVDFGKAPIYDALELKPFANKERRFAYIDRTANNMKGRLFEDYIIRYEPTYKVAYLKAKAKEQEQNNAKKKFVVPFDASDSSSFLMRRAESVDEITFEIETPKTPGTWKVVFWAVDDKQRVVQMETQIEVEEEQ